MLPIKEAQHGVIYIDSNGLVLNLRLFKLNNFYLDYTLIEGKFLSEILIVKQNTYLKNYIKQYNKYITYTT